MKNIHVLETDQPSRLHFDSELFISPEIQLSKSINSIVKGRNIYISCDVNIDEEDYCTDGIDICQIEWINNDNYKVKELNEIKPISWIKGLEKIILTTDPKLISDGVQEIDDEFLEWFVKNPNVDFVEVRTHHSGFLSDISEITSYLKIHEWKLVQKTYTYEEK